MWKCFENNLFPPFPGGPGADKTNYIKIAPHTKPAPKSSHGSSAIISPLRYYNRNKSSLAPICRFFKGNKDIIV